MRACEGRGHTVEFKFAMTSDVLSLTTPCVTLPFTVNSESYVKLTTDVVPYADSRESEGLDAHS